MLGVAGWVVVGAIAGAAAVTVINKFWEEIAYWLNNTAANAVGNVLGHNARNNMHRAVTTVGNIRNQLIHNTAVIYTKRNAMDSFYEKVTYDTTAPVYQIDKRVLNEIQKEGQLIQTFEYRN
jgi:uncharacterized membrane protein YeaQ/YmgE (transglycosylase-associated protein family)